MIPDLMAILQEAHQLDRSGQWEEAAKAYEAFLECRPDSAAAWADYGGLLLVSGRLEQARAACDRALGLDPNCPGARINMGCILVKQGQYDEAEGYFRRVLAKDPTRNDARLALAGGLMKKGDPDAAKVVLERALAQDPGHLDAHRLLCRILVNEGDISAVRREIQRRFTILGAPACAEAELELSNLSLLFGDMTRGWEEYEARLRLPLNLVLPAHQDPTCWAGQPFPGKTLLVVWEQNAADFGMYLRYAPLVKALGGRVVWLVDPALVAVAGASPDIDQVCPIGGPPPPFDFHVAMLSLPWLFKSGSAALPPEHPFFHHPLPAGLLAPPEPHLDHPRWQGEPFAGKTLLVDWEQGLGDTLMFIRYAPMVKALGGRVVWSVQDPLAEVVATCQGIDEVIPSGTPLPRFDLYVPLLSLPKVFKTELASIPCRIPYLQVPRRIPNRGSIEKLLGDSVGQLRIGLAWSGNPAHKRNAERSIPAEVLEPLGDLPGVTWYSFQYEAAKEPALPGLVLLRSHLKGFSNSAYALASMDLVITVDTALAHLAGAMGIPTCLLLHAFPDWRWLLGRSDSPWYPTLRLYRQPTAGDWPSVIQKVVMDLSRRDFPPNKTLASQG